MPLDPGLVEELKKRGLPVPGAAPQQSSDRAGLSSDRAGLWEEIKKRGLDAKPPEQAEKPGIGAALWEGLKRGGRDVIETGASIGSRMGPEEGAAAFTKPEDLEARKQAVDAGIQQSEQAYQQSPARQAHPIAAGAGRVGGNMAAAAPLAAVPGAGGAGLGSRMIGGALQGGATGGPAGAVAGGLTGGLGSAIGPMLDPAFQAIAQKIPQLAQMATGAMGRTPEAFQTAFANWVLDPIKQMVPKGIKAGEGLVNHIGDELDAAYNKLLPRVTFRAAEPDPYTGATFKSGLADLSQKVPQAHDKDFGRLIDNEINKRLDAGGNMSGTDYKKAISDIGREARRYSKWNATVDQEKYGDTLHELVANMRENLAVHNPVQADALRQVDQSWARYVRMQEAAGRRVDSNSEFRPNDLLNVAKKEYGARAFAEGKQPLMAWGRAGNDLISQKPPAFKRYLGDLVGAGLGAAAGHAVGGPIGAGVGATMGGGLADVGRGAISAARASPAARKTGEAISRMAPIAGTGGGAIDRAAKRLKAAQKVGEIQQQRHLANRRGDFAEVQSLGKKLAEAHKDYRDLGGQA